MKLSTEMLQSVPRFMLLNKVIIKTFRKILFTTFALVDFNEAER